MLRRIRLVGSCIIGTLVAGFPAGLIAQHATADKTLVVFLVSLAPLAVLFTLLLDRFWITQAKSSVEAFDTHLRKRYNDGQPPIGE